MSSSAALSGLPQPFVQAMRKLFDILDKDGSGAISLEGIITVIQTFNIFHNSPDL